MTIFTQFGSTTGVPGWGAALPDQQLYNKVEKLASCYVIELTRQPVFLPNTQCMKSDKYVLIEFLHIFIPESEGRLLCVLMHSFVLLF